MEFSLNKCNRLETSILKACIITYLVMVTKKLQTGYKPVTKLQTGYKRVYVCNRFVTGLS